MESAYNWLRENGLDDIIKNEVSVQFEKAKTQEHRNYCLLQG